MKLSRTRHALLMLANVAVIAFLLLPLLPVVPLPQVAAPTFCVNPLSHCGLRTI